MVYIEALSLNSTMKTLGYISILLTLFLSTPASSVFAQQSKPSSSSSTESTIDEKSEEIIKRALETVGGNAFLNVRTVVGRGFFTTYHEGSSQVPARFIDYIAYPDKERTEFSGGGIRVIQTNSGNTGWVFDGATKTITDMKEDQIEDFKRSMRTSLENLLRGWWREEGGSVKYLGRREAGLANRNETIRLTYPDGFWIEYEFGARDGRPAKLIYERTRKKPESDETEVLTEEDRLAQPISVAGITAPWVIDHFSNGRQTSRINYESIQYNQPLADSLFVKPDNVKSIK
jgi:hypothetical protein